MNSPDGTMQAMRASAADAASLSLDRVPIPSPGPGEVLVRVVATAVTAQELTWPERMRLEPGSVAALHRHGGEHSGRTGR